MSPIAARKFAAIVQNLERVLAIELIVAFQAMEFLRPLRSTVCVLEARCRPAAETTARPPLHQLLTSDVTGPSGRPEIDPDSVVTRVRALLQDATESLHVASVLCHSAGVNVDAKLLAHMPRDLQEEFVNGWRRYLGALARERPLVLHLEDLHWADPSFLRLIDRVTFAGQLPLFTLATARPEFADSGRRSRGRARAARRVVRACARP